MCSNGSVIVDNVLYETLDHNRVISQEFSDICSDLYFYADNPEICYLDIKDKIWYDIAIPFIDGFNYDFDPITSYMRCREIKTIYEQDINIVQGWLILKTHIIFGG